MHDMTKLNVVPLLANFYHLTIFIIFVTTQLGMFLFLKSCSMNETYYPTTLRVLPVHVRRIPVIIEDFI